MAPTKQEVAKQFLERRERNLAFFKRRFPELYARFKDFNMSRVEVQVGTEGSDVELVIDGVAQYHGAAMAYAKDEADRFLHQHRGLHQVRTISPIDVSRIDDPGLSGHRVGESLRQSPVTRDNAGNQTPIHFLPMVVFMGVGLGYHIQEVMDRVEVVETVVFEPDPEVFAATLFSVDWGSIHDHIKGKMGYRLRFLVGREGVVEAQLRDSVQAELLNSEPQFPVRVSYYNHRQDADNHERIDAVTKGTKANLTGMGCYTDELARFNNLLHNMVRPMELLVPGFSERCSKPVLIVGSGPSIDDRLEHIKAVRSKVLLVSAGTGLKVLVRNGVYPDFHVELDRRYYVYEHLAQLEPESIRDTILLASAEVNPLVPELFDNTVYYLKNHNYAQLFDGSRQVFSWTGQTCSNAALCIFSNLGFSNFFLFGCDFGFRDHESHHAKDSVYGENDESDLARSLRKQVEDRLTQHSTFEVEGVQGGAVHTRPDFDAARANVAAQVRRFEKNGNPLQVANCSDGARIEGAPWMSGEAFIQALEVFSSDSVGTGDNRWGFLNTESVEGGVERSRAVAGDVVDGMRQRCTEIRKALNRLSLHDRRDMTRVCRLVRQVAVKLPNCDSKSGAGRVIAAHLLVGTVRLFVLAGYSHALAMNDDDSLTAFLKHWRQAMDNFLSEVPEHMYASVMDRRPPAEDPLVLDLITPAGDMEESVETNN